MKQTITLIKAHRELELAHLYEHLYLSAIVKFMNANRLLDYLDYRWRGKTYVGFTYIAITLISPEAKQLASKLHTLIPDFSEKSIEGHYIELTSENKKVMAGYKERILDALLEIQTRPWHTIESMPSFDAKKVRQSRKIVWETSEKAKTKTIDVSVSLDNKFASNNRDLLPLFHVISMALLQNIYISVNMTFSFYYEDQKGIYNSKTTSERDRLRVWTMSQATLEDVVTVCKEKISAIIELGIVGKIVAFTQLSPVQAEGVRADELDIFELCKIIIGDKGWREIGTETNICNILRHSSLQIKMGRNSTSFRLGQFVI